MPSGPQSPAPRPAPSPYGGTPRAGGTPYGGHSSGSFPAAPRPAGAADNKVLWIVLGVVAAVAIIAIIVVSMSGGDDGGTNGGSNGGADSGYTAAVEEGFVTSCVEQGGTESTCGCAWTEVTETISFERFTEIEAELLEDPTATPPELTEILATCMGS